jgi:hypothetical protein
MTPFELAQIRAIIFKARYRLTTELAEIAHQLAETEHAMALALEGTDAESAEGAENDMEELGKILVDILSKGADHDMSSCFLQ